MISILGPVLIDSVWAPVVFRTNQTVHLGAEPSALHFVYLLCTKKRGLAQLGWSLRPEESGRETGKALAIRAKLLVHPILSLFYPYFYCGDVG